MAAKERYLAIKATLLIYALRNSQYPISTRIDNNGARDLAQNATINERSKHIDVKYNFVRESAHAGKIRLERCDSADQVADPLTKPLDKTDTRKAVCNARTRANNQTELLKSRRECGLCAS